MNYCKWFLDFVEKDLYKLHNIFYSDEAWFSLLRYVNSCSNCMWSTTNPHARLETPLHPLKIGVRCEISGYRITGAIFWGNDYNGGLFRNYRPIHHSYLFISVIASSIKMVQKRIQHMPPWQY